MTRGVAYISDPHRKGTRIETAAYALMAAHEDRHWWFVGRRAVIAALLNRIELPDHPAILEAGCGSGGNLGLLDERGDVSAFEPFDGALSSARHRHPGSLVRRGSLPDDVPFDPDSFDLVAALDVLEHVEDDEAALAALIRLVKPGGSVLLTVPAHQLLWGSHDRRLHHVKRYGRQELRSMVRDAGAEVVFETAFNTILSPIAIVYRLLENVSGARLGNQERLPPAPVNALLGWLFSLERRLVARFALPFGLSYAMILRRPLDDRGAARDDAGA